MDNGLIVILLWAITIMLIVVNPLIASIVDQRRTGAVERENDARVRKFLEIERNKIGSNDAFDCNEAEEKLLAANKTIERLLAVIEKLLISQPLSIVLNQTKDDGVKITDAGTLYVDGIRVFGGKKGDTNRVTVKDGANVDQIISGREGSQKKEDDHHEKE